MTNTCCRRRIHLESLYVYTKENAIECRYSMQAQAQVHQNAMNSAVPGERWKSSCQPRYTHIIITSQRATQTCCPVSSPSTVAASPLFIIYPKCVCIQNSEWKQHRKSNSAATKTNENRETINWTTSSLTSSLPFFFIHLQSLRVQLQFTFQMLPNAHTVHTAHTP